MRTGCQFINGAWPGSTNSSELHNQRNVIAILKKSEELAYDQAFKLENSVQELTGLVSQF